MNWLSILKNKRSFKDLRQLREEGVRQGKQRRKPPPTGIGKFFFESNDLC